MRLHPSNCFHSPLNVHPKNWATRKASVKKIWYITYRFYCPSVPGGKLVMIKGMNHFKTLEERQKAVVEILHRETEKLRNGFNPFAKTEQPSTGISISPETPFVMALETAKTLLSVAEVTQRDIRTTLNLIRPAALAIGIADVPISLIKRKDIKLLLYHIQEKRGYSAHRHNKLRSYLMVLYNQLMELDAVEVNIIQGIAKQKKIQQLRKILSPQDRKKIDDYLKMHHYRFWLFVNVFFHSGARISELLTVKCSDVDLCAQTLIVTVKKGQSYKQILKPVKTVSLPFWTEALQGGKPDEYVFAKGLVPGNIPIQPFQLTKRWNLHVKKKLGISEDLYSLKHLNLDETAAALSPQDASAMASHTSVAVTMKHYLMNENARQIERLKNVSNSFS